MRALELRNFHLFGVSILGLVLGLSASGCNEPDETCAAGQAGCECLQGLCAFGLQCLDGVCIGDGGTDSGDGDGDGDSTGDGDADPTGDGDPGEVPGAECPGGTLAASGSLPLNLDVARISGQIRLSGGVMVDHTSTRGSIVFTEVVQGITGSYSVGATGPATYALALPEGTYDVAWVGDPSTCDDTPTPAFPCNRGVIAKGLQLSGDVARDFDIDAVQIVGGVTQAGQVLPNDAANRGYIGFYSEDDVLAVSGALGATGPGSYSISLFPGTYEIRWIGNTALCDDSQASAVACNTGRLASGVALTQSGNVDVDVDVVSLTGQVRVNNQAMGAESGSRGSLVFENGFGSVSTRNFGSTGAASYAITLVADRYDVLFDGNDSLCDGQPSVPCNAGTLLSDADLKTSGVLDMNVPAIKLSGAVTVNGAAMPSESSGRGSLSFTNAEGRTFVSKSFGAAGAVSYAATLLPGTYTIGLVGNASLCSEPLSVGVPCMSGPLLEEIALTKDGGLNVDIPAIQLSGAVTVDGQPLANWSTNRGSLSFTLASDDPDAVGGIALSNSFGSSGAGVYSVTVMPGVYDIGWKAAVSACDDGTAPVPCVDGTIIEAVTLNQSGAVNVDADLIQLSGPVMLEGATLPNESGNRGSISFRRIDGGTTVLPSLGSTGPANYQISLLPGDYVVSHVANASLCNGAVNPQVPCASQVVLGCD